MHSELVLAFIRASSIPNAHKQIQQFAWVYIQNKASPFTQ